MPEAVIVDAIRSPIGRAFKGSLTGIRPDDLGAFIVDALLDRNPDVDPNTVERIAALAIPPAWKDVWISPKSGAKLQATGVDGAGRRQYLYHPAFRAAQEEAKFERLIRFGERLPDMRKAMAEHMDNDDLDPERVCAIALRLIDHGWFRVGNERCPLEAHRHDGVSRSDTREVPLEERLVADVAEERNPDRRRLDERLGQRCAPCLLEDQHPIELVHPEPAVRLGHGQPDDAELGELRPELG